MELQPRNRISVTTEAVHRQAALAVLMRQGECTAAELAEQRVPVQVMRRHLRGLQEDQLVEASSSQSGLAAPAIAGA